MNEHWSRRRLLKQFAGDCGNTGLARIFADRLA
jgi:hypothetical protein